MMLLIEPPLTFEQWNKLLPDYVQFRLVFADYCERYRAAVLSLPPWQLSKIWAELAQGLRQCDVGPEFLHVVIERELKERDFDATRKAAKLIVLTTLIDLLSARGVRVADKTEGLLYACQTMVPKVLAMAVTMHFGILKGS